MFKSICYLSVTEFRGRKPRLDTVVVSILDQSEAESRPRLAGWRSVLALTFEDSFEEDKLTSAGHWSDEPTDEEHAQYCQRRGERVPALSDARRLVGFLEPHRKSPEELHLIVHCFAGFSRSAAVAAWVSARAWLPLSNPHSRKISMANPRLLRLLDKAYQETST